MFLRRDLPQLLQPDAEFLRLAILRKLETRDDLLRQRSARAFGKQRILRAQLHAARERILVLARLADAHVPGGDPDDFAAVAVKHLGRRKPRIDLNAERLRFGGKPAAYVAERNNE